MTPRHPPRHEPTSSVAFGGVLIVVTLAAWGLIGLVVFGAITAWRAIEWVLS